MQNESSPTPSQVSTPPTETSVNRPPASKKMPGKSVLLVVGGIVVLIIALVCIYIFWYQNPQKVITDAAANALTAEQVSTSGTINVKGGDNAVTVDFNGTTAGKMGTGTIAIDVATKDVKLKADVELIVAENADVYVKVTKLQEAADTLIDQVTSSYGADLTPEQKSEVVDRMRESFNPIVKKLDGKWIVIKPSDIEDSSNDISDIQTCLKEVNTLLREDKAATSEIRSAYTKNQFVVIDKKLGSKDGALGYEVSVDEAKAKAFGEAAKDSKLAKKLKSCSDNNGKSSKSSSDSDDSSVKKVELWVDRWTHNLDKMSVEASQEKSDINLNASFDYKKPVDIKIPSDAMTVDELKREIESLSLLTTAV